MVSAKATGAPLRETRFDNPPLASLGIEPMRLAELRGKLDVDQFALPERVDFHLLLLVTHGHGKHAVDFVEYTLTPGTLVFVRPGQVQQWHPGSALEAELVLISPEALPQRGGQGTTRELELMHLDEWPACSTLPKTLADEITENLWRLRRDFDDFDGGHLDAALIRHELLTVLLRIAKRQVDDLANEHAQAGNRATYRLFLRELEGAFHTQHSLQHYAKRLGYAESTLSRACVRAEGRSAKQVIDRRIALEAQRMLAHSAASVAEIGHRLGFSEPTNFVKFFRRMIGATPAAFRLRFTAKSIREPRQR